MKVIFFGTGEFGLPALKFLKDSSHTLLGVVTSPDKPRGRNLKRGFSPVKQWAADQHISLFQWQSLKTEEPRKILKNACAEVFAVADYGFILPEEILSIPHKLCLNIHASLLPRYRGAAPVQWAIMNGETVTGITIFKMSAKLDAGEILLQKKEKIRPEDDSVSLEKRLSETGGAALIEALKQVEHGLLSLTPQDDKLASQARKITKEDGRLDWHLEPELIRNRVRALLPWPKCYTFYEGKRLVIAEVTVSGEHTPESILPGTVVEASASKGLFVTASGGILEIKKIQLEGRKMLSSNEFLKGFSLRRGSVLA